MRTLRFFVSFVLFPFPFFYIYFTLFYFGLMVFQNSKEERDRPEFYPMKKRPLSAFDELDGMC